MRNNPKDYTDEEIYEILENSIGHDALTLANLCAVLLCRMNKQQEREFKNEDY
jgi:hypothetical protein